MYISIRKYTVRSPEELVEKVRDGFVPIVRSAPGFVGYQVMRDGNTVASISMFETRQGAEESNRIAADWVRQNIAPMVMSGPEIMAGEVMLQVGEVTAQKAM